MPDRSYTPRHAERARWIAGGALVLGVALFVVLSGGRRGAPRGFDANPIAADATNAAATFEAIKATVDARFAVARPTITGERPPTPSLVPSLEVTATIMAATLQAAARVVPALPPPPELGEATRDPNAGPTATGDAAAVERYVRAMVGIVEEADAMADGEQGWFAATDFEQVCDGPGRLAAPIEAHMHRLDEGGLVAEAAAVSSPAGEAAEVHGRLVDALEAWRRALWLTAALCGGNSRPLRPTDGTLAGGAAAVQRVRLAAHAFRRLAAQGDR